MEAVDKAEALVEALREKIKDVDGESERLDDMVINACCAIASGINNGGLDEQVEFLLSEGFTEKDIWEAFDGVD